MKYFGYLKEELRCEIFYKQPEKIDYNDSEILKYAVGAALYMPATRQDLADIIISKKYPQVRTLVVCLEDAIKDEDVEYAELNLINQLSEIKVAVKASKIKKEEIPLLFIRVRSPKHFEELSPKVHRVESLLTGFVFPKFDSKSGLEYVNVFKKFNEDTATKHYFMPILESSDLMYVETRLETLNFIKKLLSNCREDVLNIRIGATDFCSYFGIRRGKDYTVYEIQLVRDCINAILNLFLRKEENYIVSGTVWEYFDNDRLLKPLLRATPFHEFFGEQGLDLRSKLIENNLDGLIREILKDKENGMVGKTVIHPSHVTIVNALYAVNHEEYLDAMAIIGEDGNGGVFKSDYGNKMNEVKPHTYWAKKILTRAKVYGVFNKGYDYLSIISQLGGMISEK